jgi:hypothetical protein
MNAPAGTSLTTMYDTLEPIDWKNLSTTGAANIAAPTTAQGTATVPTAGKSTKPASKIPAAQPTVTTTGNPNIGDSTKKPVAKPTVTTTGNPEPTAQPTVTTTADPETTAQPTVTTMTDPGYQDGDETGKDN